MSRIVALVHGLYPYQRAGSETMLDDMLAALVERGHEVHAIATESGPDDGSTRWEHRGYTCWREDESEAFDLAVMHDPDLIVSHHHLAPGVVVAARALGIPAAVIVHNDFKWSRAMLNAGPDLIVYNTHWLKRKMGPRGADALVVHPPLHADRYAIERASMADVGDAVTIVNLDRIKGPDIFYALAARFPDTPFRAVRGAYGRQDERSGFANVEFIDTTTDMRAVVWAPSRVVIAPSRYESYGRGVVEACAAGLPVVASPTAGLRESLGPAGSWCTRGDIAAWVRFVGRYLHDDDAWVRASGAALARAAELDTLRRVELAQWCDAVERAAWKTEQRRRPPVAPTATAP